MSNKIKSEQLGMPFGTASNRLRKMVLFQLLKEYNRNFCYQCGKEISSVEELSIEHKEPWLYSENPKEKFFDIENIAFSHLDCNCKVKRNPMKNRGKSKYRGVYWDDSARRKKNWRANIQIGKSVVKIGRFHTEKEAARAYDEKAIEVFGDKAILNFGGVD